MKAPRAAKKKPPVRVIEFDPRVVREVSVAVYRERMGAKDAAAYIEKRGEASFRSNAAGYDGLTRAYMRAILSR